MARNWAYISPHTSRGTLRQKHIDAFARTLGFLFFRYGCNFGNSNGGETQVVIATKALSAASHTNRLSCEDLRSSCRSCKGSVWLNWGKLLTIKSNIRAESFTIKTKQTNIAAKLQRIQVYQRVQWINYKIVVSIENICRCHNCSFANSTSWIFQRPDHQWDHIFPIEQNYDKS